MTQNRNKINLELLHFVQKVKDLAYLKLSDNESHKNVKELEQISFNSGKRLNSVLKQFLFKVNHCFVNIYKIELFCTYRYLLMFFK